LKGEDGNLAFDGIKLKVFNDDRVEFDSDTTVSRWVEGNTNMKFTIARSPLNLTSRQPADYEVIFSEEIIDSALAVTTGLVTIGVKYSVRDVTRGVPIRVPTFLNENFDTKNEAWDPGEPIIFFITGSEGGITDTTTWELLITNPPISVGPPILPTDGDLLFIRIKRPFTVEDEFVLTTEAGKVKHEDPLSELDNIYVVPNPYIGYSIIEPTNRLPGTTRGERRLYFENLPERCTIRIFTLSGDPVATLEHNGTMESGREYWNLLNKDGFSVAYGVYIAHIDAPGIGEKLVKFAIIK
jgi:hypothetical protein